MKSNADYYQILQVSFGADKAAIISSYKRLCKLYHPDVSKLPHAQEMMAQINVAYDTLRDDRKRSAYDSRYQARRGSSNHWTPPPRPAASMPDARVVIQEYFECLLKGAYEKAYQLLCESDKSRVGTRSFCHWRQTVQELYAMRQFSVKRGKKISDYKLDDGRRVPAEQFYVDVLEKDHISGSVDHYCFTKYVIYEQGRCGVFLGYRDLNEIAKQFDDWARAREQNLMRQHWQEHLQTTDRKTGLLTREGLLSQAKRDLYRARRYDRGLTVVCFTVRPAYQNLPLTREEELLEAVAQVLKKSLRLTDTSAYLGNGVFAVLYAELKRRHAVNIIERMLKQAETAAQAACQITVRTDYRFESYSGGPLELYLDRLAAKLSLF